MLLLETMYTNSELSDPLTVTEPSDSINSRLLRLTRHDYYHSEEYSSEIVPSIFISASQRNRKRVPNFTVDCWNLKSSQTIRTPFFELITEFYDLAALQGPT